MNPVITVSPEAPAVAAGKTVDIEVQIAGDGERVIALGDRDCSLQRRHQKIIEIAPAPALPDSMRQALHAAAVKLGQALRSRCNLQTAHLEKTGLVAFAKAMQFFNCLAGELRHSA